ncbi:hypothetical protein [Caulobacter sp. S45]|uniref:hypothetical protein n=1 Tax=Caulobacter sp. S45 TaxID=1641861 RepID=UPI0015758E50|nr:hypothetical protein [Caulobacter sp. S45]
MHLARFPRRRDTSELTAIERLGRLSAHLGEPEISATSRPTLAAAVRARAQGRCNGLMRRAAPALAEAAPHRRR